MTPKGSTEQEPRKPLGMEDMSVKLSMCDEFSSGLGAGWTAELIDLRDGTVINYGYGSDQLQAAMDLARHVGWLYLFQEETPPSHEEVIQRVAQQMAGPEADREVRRLWAREMLDVMKKLGWREPRATVEGSAERKVTDV